MFSLYNFMQLVVNMKNSMFVYFLLTSILLTTTTLYVCVSFKLL